MKRLEERKIHVLLTDEAKDQLVEEGYDPAYGARPLKRTIQRRVLDPLALRVLEGDFGEGDTVVVDAGAGALLRKARGGERIMIGHGCFQPETDAPFQSAGRRPPRPASARVAAGRRRCGTGWRSVLLWRWRRCTSWRRPAGSIPYSEFKELVKNGAVAEVTSAIRSFAAR